MINERASTNDDLQPAPALSLTRAEYDALVGRTSKYRLVGRRTCDADRQDVSPGSPLGRALLGAAENAA